MSAMTKRRRIMVSSALALCGGTGLSASALAASSGAAVKRNGQGPWTDPRASTYDTYLSAWGPVDDGKRLSLLRESLSDDVVFTNPMQTRRGIADVVAHLEGFQKRSPGARFQTNEMLGWEHHGLATWQFVDAQGQQGFWGYDVVEFDASGRMRSILLFGHSEKTILK